MMNSGRNWKLQPDAETSLNSSKPLQTSLKTTISGRVFSIHVVKDANKSLNTDLKGLDCLPKTNNSLLITNLSDHANNH